MTNPSLLDFVNTKSFNKFDKVVQNAFISNLQKERLYPFHLRAMQELVGMERCYHNYHIEVISDYLEKCYSGEIKRLIINMPPRHGKTALVNISFPAWVMGKHPDAKIISTSYSQEIANDPSRSFRSLVRADFYKKLFPEFIIAKKKSENHIDTTLGGFRYSVGMRGTITGKGADFIIVDDPHKPEDTNSPKMRLLDCEWFENTLQSRLDNQNTGVIIIVAQRLHMNDLSGYLIEKGGWEVLNIPAINSESQIFAVDDLQYKKINIIRNSDTALMPRIASYEQLNRLKAEVGINIFNAQYLQNPLPEDGLIFKPEWFIEYDKLPDKKPSLIIQSWDTALKDGEENDYSVCVTMNVYVDNPNKFTHYFYITNIYRAKLNFPNLRDKAIELRRLYNPDKVVIEDKGAGTSLIQTLRKNNISCIEYTPKRSKKERFTGITGYYADERIRFFRHAEWLEELRKEILTFPSGNHDDMVDAITQGVDYFRSNYKEVRIWSL